MTDSDMEAQLAILADALTQIVETATIGSTSKPGSSLEYLEQRLEHNGEIAAQALVAAATFGPLRASPLRKEKKKARLK